MTLFPIRFKAAEVYAAFLHRNQTRKVTGEPYFTHLREVEQTVREYGGTWNERIAALLHDGPEDQGGERVLRFIRRVWGEEVANTVAGCTDGYEHTKQNWWQRKEAYIAHIRDELRDPHTMLVSMADKTANSGHTLADHRKQGDDVWGNFAGGKEGTLRYYAELTDAYRAALASMQREGVLTKAQAIKLPRLLEALERNVGSLLFEAGCDRYVDWAAMRGISTDGYERYSR